VVTEVRTRPARPSTNPSGSDNLLVGVWALVSGKYSLFGFQRSSDHAADRRAGRANYPLQCWLARNHHFGRGRARNLGTLLRCTIIRNLRAAAAVGLGLSRRSPRHARSRAKKISGED
jgi:hypothetical protein